MNQLVPSDLFILMIDDTECFTPASLEDLRGQVHLAVPRLRELGSWPGYIDAERSLVSRVPTMLSIAPGFDAGIACSLDMIPREKQKLSATLHAAYTEAAVEQVRRETSGILDADSETCWWLAASSICEEGNISHDAFLDQLHAFRELVRNPEERRLAAVRALADMHRNFRLMDGIPFVTKDGGLQGAYISGYDWGVQYIEAYGLFFIGTFRESLGLEKFNFSTRVDAEMRPMSGPVHGSRQLVKASAMDELVAALEIVRKHLGQPKK
jgi:hypothetical protein